MTWVRRLFLTFAVLVFTLLPSMAQGISVDEHTVQLLNSDDGFQPILVTTAGRGPTKHIVEFIINPEIHDEVAARGRFASDRPMQAIRVPATANGQPAAPEEPLSLLGGALTVELPIDPWRLASSRDDVVTFFTSGTYQGFISIEIAERAMIAAQLTTTFSEQPEEAGGEIMGRPARLFSGRHVKDSFQLGTRMVPGPRRLALLDECLASGAPVAITYAGLDRLFDDTTFDQFFANASVGDLVSCSTASEQRMPTEGMAAAPGRIPSEIPQGMARESIGEWETYLNARFGTMIEYPSGLFQMQPPPANDDGRTFETIDGQIRMIVFAGHNVLDEDPQSRLTDLTVSGGYSAIKRVEFSDERIYLRGMRDEMVVRRTELFDPEGFIHTLEITADPSAEQSLLDEFDRIEQSFAFAGEPEPPAQYVDAQHELVFWQSIANSSDPADFEAYLARWPEGTFAALAENRLRQLGRESTDPMSRALGDRSTRGSVPPPPRRGTRAPISNRHEVRPSGPRSWMLLAFRLSMN